MPTTKIKFLYIFELITLLALNLNVTAVAVGRIFRIDQLANKVNEDLMERKSWCGRFFGSKPEPTVNGIGIVLAFERHGVDEIVSPCVTTKYSILDILHHFDQRICEEFVKYRREHGHKDWSSFSEQDFIQLNAIQRKFLDPLPIVLEAKYGEAAKPYVDEIKIAREEFEKRNNGYLLERN